MSITRLIGSLFRRVFSFRKIPNLKTYILVCEEMNGERVLPLFWIKLKNLGREEGFHQALFHDKSRDEKFPVFIKWAR